MKDKEQRTYLIENGIYKQYINERKMLIKNGVVFITNDFKLNYSLFTIPYENLKICERIRRCYKAQREKVEYHIMYLFNKKDWDLFFVTFTFTDKALTTKPNTRKQNIIRLLSRCDDYILNIDYGTNTDREHYHSILAIRKGTYEIRKENGHIKLSILDNYKMGTYDVKEIRKTDDDKKRLSRYIAKLTMHSVKVKQKYISVKKGSEYQMNKKIKKKVMYQSRGENHRIFADDDLYDDLMANEI